MSLNLGSTDRGLRIVLAVILVAFPLAGLSSGALSIVLWVVAALLLVTGVLGYCPAYAVLGISTRAHAGAGEA